jgi:hypothetical protein
MPKKPKAAATAAAAKASAGAGRGLGKSTGAAALAAAVGRHNSDKAHRRALAAERRRAGHASYVSEVATLRRQHGEAGLALREVQGDGNCLFRAVSDQLFGHEGEAQALRARCCDYLATHSDSFSPFLLEEEGWATFDEYVRAMRGDGEWAGNMELQALSLALRLNFVIHQAGQPHWELVNAHDGPPAAGGRAGKGGTGAATTAGPRALHLAYQEGDHYNSVRGAGDNTAMPAAQIVFGNGRTTVALAAASPQLASGSKAAKGGARRSGDGGAGGGADLEAALAMVMYALPTGVAAATGAARIRELLADLDGDADAAVELLLAEAAAAAEAGAAAPVDARCCRGQEAALVPSGAAATGDAAVVGTTVCKILPGGVAASRPAHGPLAVATCSSTGSSPSDPRPAAAAHTGQSHDPVATHIAERCASPSASPTSREPLRPGAYATDNSCGEARAGLLASKLGGLSVGDSRGLVAQSSHRGVDGPAASEPRVAAATGRSEAAPLPSGLPPSCGLGLGNGIKRSKACPCGSGKPYKRCHEEIDRAAARRAAAVAAGVATASLSGESGSGPPPPPRGQVVALTRGQGVENEGGTAVAAVRI